MIYYLCGVISNLHLCFSIKDTFGRPLCGWVKASAWRRSLFMYYEQTSVI